MNQCGILPRNPSPHSRHQFDVSRLDNFRGNLLIASKVRNFTGPQHTTFSDYDHFICQGNDIINEMRRENYDR